LLFCFCAFVLIWKKKVYTDGCQLKQNWFGNLKNKRKINVRGRTFMCSWYCSWETMNIWERKEGIERKKLEREKFWKKWVIPPFSSVYGRRDPVRACPSRYRAPSLHQPLIFIALPRSSHQKPPRLNWDRLIKSEGLVDFFHYPVFLWYILGC
jgi:hypothetical protein